jgi:hypothetical protein
MTHVVTGRCMYLAWCKEQIENNFGVFYTDVKRELA